MTINLRQDAPDQVDVFDPTELSEAIEQLKSVGAQVLAVESKLKELKAQEKYINNFTIPEIMSKMNLSTVKLKDGSELSIKKVYSATMKADKKAEAIQWLRNNGLGDIVKNEITVNFGQSEDNKAIAYANLAQGQGFQPVQKLKVEPMTLKALVRERLESGQEMPTELFNVFAGNRTKITKR